MKNLSKFEAFKLDKVQMNAIAGGAVCTVDFGGGYVHTVANDKMKPEDAERALKDSYGSYATISCK